MHALKAGTVKAVVAPTPQKGGPEGRRGDDGGKWRAGRRVGRSVGRRRAAKTQEGGRGHEAYKTEGMRMEKAYVKYILRVYAGHFETNATISVDVAFLLISLLFS